MALSETDKNIRENVVYLRDKTGINNAKIAKACSVSKPTVTNWILGKRTISKKNLVKLSILFGVSIDVLTSPVDRLGQMLPSSKKQAVESANRVSDNAAFLAYIESLGVDIWRDDPEHKPFLTFNGVTVVSEVDTLETLKAKIDDRARTFIKTVVNDLIDAEEAERTKENARLIQFLESEEN